MLNACGRIRMRLEPNARRPKRRLPTASAAATLTFLKVSTKTMIMEMIRAAVRSMLSITFTRVYKHAIFSREAVLGNPLFKPMLPNKGAWGRYR
jgi:hypothetical protein